MLALEEEQAQRRWWESEVWNEDQEERRRGGEERLSGGRDPSHILWVDNMEMEMGMGFEMLSKLLLIINVEIPKYLDIKGNILTTYNANGKSRS